MATSKTWTVIEFLDGQTVEAVPTSWILQNQCYWPPLSREKLAAEIKKCELPNTCWPLYDVRIFKNATYDNYQIARVKAKKAEETSDLNSENEKRRVKPSVRILSSSESDKENETIPDPPKLPKSQVFKTNHEMKKRLLLQQTRHEDKNDSQFSLGAKKPNANSLSNENLVCNCCPIHQSRIETFLDRILKKQTILAAQLSQLSEDINVLKISNSENGLGHVESVFTKFDLPLQSKEMLQIELDQYLSDQNNFDASVQDLVKIGGDTPYEFTRRCLVRLITNELATHFTFYGSNKKEAFSKLKIWELLKKAAAKQNAVATEDMSEKNVQKWLRRAKERMNYEHK